MLLVNTMTRWAKMVVPQNNSFLKKTDQLRYTTAGTQLLERLVWIFLQAELASTTLGYSEMTLTRQWSDLGHFGPDPGVPIGEPVT